MSAISPTTTYLTREPASVPALAWAGDDAAARRAGRVGAVGVADTVAVGLRGEVMSAATAMARAAFTVPYPPPAAERAGSGGRLAPLAVSVVPSGVVLAVSARVTCATVRLGNLARRRAARPATMPLAVPVVLIWL
jgi:hypothetical protein